MKQFVVRAVVLACGTLGVVACTSQQRTETSFVAPEAESARMRSIVAVYLGDPATARIAEQRMADAARSRGAQALPAFQAFGQGDDGAAAAPSADEALARAERQGFQGAVVMQLVGLGSRTMTAEPGTGTPPGAGRAREPTFSPAAEDQQRLRRDELLVQVETSVYSLTDNRLVYRARTESFAPASTDAMMARLARSVTGELERRGILD